MESELARRSAGSGTQHSPSAGIGSGQRPSAEQIVLRRLRRRGHRRCRIDDVWCVVATPVDLLPYLVGCHRLGRIGLQQMDRRRFRREPAVVVRHVDDDRHGVVKLGHLLIGAGRSVARVGPAARQPSGRQAPSKVQPGRRVLCLSCRSNRACGHAAHLSIVKTRFERSGDGDRRPWVR